MCLSRSLRLFFFFLFFSSGLVWGGPPAPAPLIVEHGPRNKQKIALPFDTCPTGTPDEYDEKVVEVLLREKVAATLFLSGRGGGKNTGRAKYSAGLPPFG